MSEEELVNAYAAGHISRRVFIRRLIQGGISVTAALVYADSLASPAGAVSNNDGYLHNPEKHHHHHHRDHHRHKHHHKHHKNPY